MGLAQKRIISEYQTSAFPEWKKKFDTVVGFEIPFEVKWDTMQDDAYHDRDRYFEWYGLVYFEPLMTVFQKLCSDNMGREAVKTGVKKIVIDGTEGTSAKKSTFENGVLTIKHQFNMNTNDEAERTKTWLRMIEDKL